MLILTTAAALVLLAVSSLSLSQTSKSYGMWGHKVTADPITDIKTTIFTNVAVSNTRSASVKMALYCQQGVKAVSVSIGNTFQMLSETRVLTRVDGKTHQSNIWLGTSGLKTLFIPPDHVDGLLTDLYGGEQLLVRIAPESGPNIDVEMDIFGINKAINELRRVCDA